jgi:hypothetical protein
MNEESHFIFKFSLIWCKKVKVKVKGSRIRSGVAQRVPGVIGSQISMTFGTWWLPPLPTGNIPVTHFRSQGHGKIGRNVSLKNPVTPPGIDPGTVRLVPQRLYHYATPGPSYVMHIRGKILDSVHEFSTRDLWNFTECHVLCKEVKIDVF